MFVKSDLYPSLTVGTLFFPDLDCYLNGWTFVFFVIHQRRNGNRTQNIDIFSVFPVLNRFPGVMEWYIAKDECEDPLVEGANGMNFFCCFLEVWIC